jgi:hypothetical protein
MSSMSAPNDVDSARTFSPAVSRRRPLGAFASRSPENEMVLPVDGLRNGSDRKVKKER